MWELVFTSAKAGLIPGRSGFCSVAWTTGMPQNLVTLLENMSGYNALYMPDDPKASLNPVCYSYQKVRYGQKDLRVLSRIAFAGLDYTGRTNKIAHHIVIEDDSELMHLTHGPISAFLNEENFITEWNEPPRLLDPKKPLTQIKTSGHRADRWDSLAGDPQWAGIIADSFMESDEKSCLYLEYDNEAHRNDVLYLIDEIARLLPKDKVLDFTFTTYFTNAQNGVNCFFRAALPNCPALPAIKRFKAKDLVSLINPAPAPRGYESSPSVVAAITGNAPVRTVAMPVEMEEDDASPQQPAMEIPRGRGRQPKRPPSSSAADTKRREQERRLASGNMSPPMRLTLFALGALMLLVFIGVGAWVTVEMMKTDEVPVSQEKKKEPTALETNIEPEEKKDPAADQGEAPQADKPQTTTQEKSAADEKKESPQQVAEQNARKKAAEDERKRKEKATSKQTLSPRSNFELFKGYVELQRSKHRVKKISIKLPDELKDATGFSVKINVWDMDIDEQKLESYVERAEKSFRAYALAGDTDTGLTVNKTKGEECLCIVLTNGTLEISGKDRQRLLKHHVESIVFQTENGKYTWDLNWSDDFLQFIPEGSFDENFVYQKSEEETLFSDFVEIHGGDKRGEKREAERNYNDYKKKQEVLSDLKAKKKKKEEEEKNWKTVQQLYKDIMKELQKKDPNFGKVAQDFSDFYEKILQVPDSCIKSYLESEFKTREGKILDTEKKKKDYKEYKEAKEVYEKADNAKRVHGTGKKDKEKKYNDAKKKLDSQLLSSMGRLETDRKAAEEEGPRQYLIKKIDSLWEKKATKEPEKSAYDTTYNDKINKISKNSASVSSATEKSIDQLNEEIEVIEALKRPSTVDEKRKTLKIERAWKGKSR